MIAAAVARTALDVGQESGADKTVSPIPTEQTTPSGVGRFCVAVALLLFCRNGTCVDPDPRWERGVSYPVCTPASIPQSRTCYCPSLGIIVTVGATV